MTAFQDKSTLVGVVVNVLALDYQPVFSEKRNKIVGVGGRENTFVFERRGEIGC